MLIYARKNSPRLNYSLKVLFKDLLSLEYTLVNDFLFYQEADGPKIHYGENKWEGDMVFLHAMPLLFEEGINPNVPTCIWINEKPALFPAGEESDWPFDLLAMLFYLLSRYEEYLPFNADQYGRFPATESIAYRLHFLNRPILNEWVASFRSFLQEKWPAFSFPVPEYTFQLTYDIDMAWAYLHRPWWRLLGGGVLQLLRGRWRAFLERWMVVSGKKEDPYFVFNYLEKMTEKYNLNPLYFWLLGNPSRYDINPSPSTPAFRRLIQAVSGSNRVGIHPSFASNKKEGQLGIEIKRLEEMTKTPVKRSRQHFLILSFPATYRQLVQQGIKADYSMGYADQTGFRAGIASAFPWYDLENETITSLIIHPFMVMDVSLKQYLGLSPKAAIQHTQDLVKITKAVGGTFTLLWHNSSFAPLLGWNDWQTVFEEIIAFANSENL